MVRHLPGGVKQSNSLFWDLGFINHLNAYGAQQL